jgi:superfamily II DNA or RNA helicase
MQLSERLLNDAGGWQAMKHARSLHGAGRVTEPTWDEVTLTGYVKEGETRYRSGLRFISKTNIENLCTCRDSKVRGLVCAHSLAVGLEILKPSAEPKSQTPSAEAVTIPIEKGLPTGFSLETGTSVELEVVFPPNVAQAAARGTATVGVEAVVAGKRMLLSALDRRSTHRINALDARLLEVLVTLGGDGTLPGMLALNTESLLSLLEALTGHPKVSLARRSPLVVQQESLAPKLFSKTLPNGDLVLRCEMPAGGTLWCGKKTAWMLRDTIVQPVCAGLPPAYLPLLLGEVVIPTAAVHGFLQKEWGTLALRFSCENAQLPEAERQNSAVQSLERSDNAPTKPAFTLRVEGSLNFLAATLIAAYGESRSTVTCLPPVARSRNRRAENDALELLANAGFSRPDGEGQMAMRGETAILDFFAQYLPRFQKLWIVEIGERFQHVTRKIERVEPKLQVVGSGENWFELDVAMETAGGERYSGVEIRRLIQSGRSQIKRKDGSIAVFDPLLLNEFDEVLRDCSPEQRQPGRYRIANRQAGFVEAFAEDCGAQLLAPPRWKQWAASTRQAAELKPIGLGPLDEVLRGYQKQGVYWMHFLAQNGFAGILADEMGLGKTVQALAFLGTLKGRALVVAPSSLLINWKREAERFLPNRRVVVLAGSQRHGKELAEAQLIITSYAVLRIDVERLYQERFEAVILDEAQHIKNPESQAAQAAFRLRADNRFVLTGTPVENSVRDVWSLFHFLMPGYLGTRNDFRERYEQPVTQEPGCVAHRRMVQRLAPFVLRRTKKAVAPELPDKIEQVVWCELSAAQREAYAKLVDLSRREVGKAEELKNKGQARMVMLTALLRLRQACNDLRLLGDDFQTLDDSDSGKFEALEELLTEAVDGGHRVLLFSQFTSMLDLLQTWLQARHIDFCRLDGSTRDRFAQVDRFQTATVPVFLISLKAGGVGLTLTAADTVVHFDPWWNPAVEAQATDRAHRIGQKSVVTSYKLIARGTVEEKILQLQTRKRGLLDALVESEQPLMDGLTMDDLAGLLNG